MESKLEDPIVEEGNDEKEFERIDDKMEAMMKIKDCLFKKAKNNIDSAQERYKRDYDKKRKLNQVC